MTRDKLEKTCVACYAIFTDWGFLKITIFEYDFIVIVTLLLINQIFVSKI